jgi:hypothetical protein
MMTSPEGKAIKSEPVKKASRAETRLESRVARFFLVQHTKTEKNDYKICTKVTVN